MENKFSVSKDERNSILESHNRFKKILLEKKNGFLINEETADVEKDLLERAVRVGCKILEGGRIVQTKSGRYAVYIASAPTTDKIGNFQAGDKLLFYGTKTSKGYEAASKSPNSDKVFKFEWNCPQLNQPESIGSKQKVQGEVWVSETDPALYSKVNMKPGMYDEYTDPRGNKYYKNKIDSGAKEFVTDKQKQIEKYIQDTLNYGAKGVDWGFEYEYGKNWVEISLPDSEKYFGTPVKIFVDPKIRQQQLAGLQKTAGQTTSSFVVSPENCVGMAEQYLERFTSDPNAPVDSVILEMKARLKACKQKYCGTSDKPCKETQKRGLFRGKKLGKSFGETIDFFLHRSALNVDGVDYDILTRVSPFSLR